MGPSLLHIDAMGGSRAPARGTTHPPNHSRPYNDYGTISCSFIVRAGVDDVDGWCPLVGALLINIGKRSVLFLPNQRHLHTTRRMPLQMLPDSKRGCRTLTGGADELFGAA